MKTKNLHSAVALTLTLIFYFPAVSFAQGTWTQKADFPGWTRFSAASFSIGTKGYIGIGCMEFDFTPTREFWEWDQTTNVWTRKADFPGKIEVESVSFSIGSKGYIGSGSGYDNDISKYGCTNEFWEYDPATNGWTQKASLPITTAREGAVGFSIGSKGYIGTGKKDQYSGVNFPDPNYQDFWEWDQETDVWTNKSDFPGIARDGAVGFSIGNKGYIGTGLGDGNQRLKDFWEWDQATGVWSKKADYPGKGSEVSFSNGNKGYIGTGYDNTINGYTNEFWEWHQVTNDWIKISDFSGPKVGAIGSFTIGGNGYVIIGADFLTNTYYQELWEFVPSAITGLKEVAKNNNLFYPNPSSDFITLNTSHAGNSDLTLNIYNVTGELTRSELLKQNQKQHNVSDLKNGIYMIEVKSNTWSKNQKLIIQR